MKILTYGVLGFWGFGVIFSVSYLDLGYLSRLVVGKGKNLKMLADNDWLASRVCYWKVKLCIRLNTDLLGQATEHDQNL